MKFRQRFADSTHKATTTLGIVALLCLLLTSAFTQNQDALRKVVVPVTADTQVSAFESWARPREREKAWSHYGGSRELHLRGVNEFVLLQFDWAAVRGMTIERAVLRLRRHSKNAVLRRVAVSTISGSGPWGEGAQQNGRAAPETANFFESAAGSRPWAYAGSDLTDVVFGLGGSLYSYTLPVLVGDW